MKNRSLLLLLTTLTVAGFAATQVTVNLGGKNVTLDSVQVGGKTYVSLEQLKAQLGPQGGANQVSASEGIRGQWLFNGVWRLKVGEVQWDAAESQWVVQLSIGNGTSQTRDMINSGFASNGTDGVFLVTQSGESKSLGVNAANAFQDDFSMKSLPPGGQSTATIRFLGTESDRPVKLLVEMHPLKGLPFSRQPSFRVDLTRP
ncbi:MAG: hypothetical protein KF760_14380 [Candidatus Eremiobacteraeota bacterium]|nr:hypothetical protein [Candidatus Eremiobacteraeota bacterium]MCW5868273.1 hypothetical protein [Candidatus Eremiobacteraeota bacterium]